MSLGPFPLAQTDSLLPFTEDSKTEKVLNNCELRHSRLFINYDVTHAKASASCKKDMENIIDI